MGRNASLACRSEESRKRWVRVAPQKPKDGQRETQPVFFQFPKCPVMKNRNQKHAWEATKTLVCDFNPWWCFVGRLGAAVHSFHPQRDSWKSEFFRACLLCRILITRPVSGDRTFPWIHSTSVNVDNSLQKKDKQTQGCSMPNGFRLAPKITVSISGII